ncbi:hypothetical protein JI664_05180 [Rhodobacter sp. NTK016B]|uniref:hypothetical protein n=1 Tax=Rhodobacter sp. NTK016B TaxID=2759676 RepID=UPI001A8DAEC6|nr:hypothetical protein [Rhodobacter sp. NTK016B]
MTCPAVIAVVSLEARGSIKTIEQRFAKTSNSVRSSRAPSTFEGSAFKENA